MDTLPHLPENDKDKRGSDGAAEGSDCPLEVIGVVTLDPLRTLPEEEGRPGNEDDPCQGEDCENAVPNGAPGEDTIRSVTYFAMAQLLSLFKFDYLYLLTCESILKTALKINSVTGSCISSAFTSP